MIQRAGIRKQRKIRTYLRIVREIELREGVVVYVPRGVKHKAWGNLKVLVVCIPRGVLNDVHELE